MIRLLLLLAATDLGTPTTLTSTTSPGRPAGASTDEDVSASRERAEPQIEILGRRIIPETIYRALIKRQWASLDDETRRREGPARACRAVLDLLREAKFSYAVARCSSTPAGQLLVVVDEGTIENISFPGQPGMSAVAANLVFSLEHRVFNRSAFDEQVERLERALGTRMTGWELVMTSSSGFSQFQLSQVMALEDLSGIESRGRYDLLIYLEDRFMSPGPGFGLESTGPDGLVTQLQYRWADVLTEDDRFELSTEVGLRLPDLLGSDPPPLLSRGGLGSTWFGPSWEALSSRFLLGLRGRYLNRRRPDLADSTYDLVEPSARVGVLWRESEYRHASVALGVDYRALVASTIAIPAARPRTTGFVRGFVELDAGLALLQPRSKRLDHSLQLSLEARAYASALPYASFEVVAEKGVPVGTYNEVRLELRGVSLLGDYGVIDEYRVSDLFRGLYGDRLFTPRMISLSTEAFVSLERDRIRASVFLDGLLFSSSEIASVGRSAFAGVAAGLGLHALFFQAIQVSMYGLFGIAEKQTLQGGFNLSLARVF